MTVYVNCCTGEGKFGRGACFWRIGEGNCVSCFIRTLIAWHAVRPVHEVLVLLNAFYIIQIQSTQVHVLLSFQNAPLHVHESSVLADIDIDID